MASVTAHHLKVGQFVVFDNKVFEVVSKKEVKTGGHNAHFVLQNFDTNHRKEISFSLHHSFRTVEPENNHYTVSELADYNNGKQFLVLLDKNANVREDLYVTTDHVVEYLKTHFDNSDDSLDVFVTRVHVEKAHSHRIDDKDMVFEKVVSIKGTDMKHLYDHNHGYHHGHHHVHNKHHLHYGKKH